MIIEMKEHNPQWALMYADEAEKIKEILGDKLAEIYHRKYFCRGLKSKTGNRYNGSSKKY